MVTTYDLEEGKMYVSRTGDGMWVSRESYDILEARCRALEEERNEYRRMEEYWREGRV